MILRDDSTGSCFLAPSPSGARASLAFRSTAAIRQHMGTLPGQTVSRSRAPPLIIPTPRQALLLSPALACPSSHLMPQLGELLSQPLEPGLHTAGRREEREHEQHGDARDEQ